MSSSVAGIAGLLKSKATTEREKQLMKEVFALADKNGDGVLDFDEYSRILREKGLKLSKKEIRKIFNKIDKNKDNKLSPNELWDEEQDVKDKAVAAMRAYDQNKDGYVSKKEMAMTSGRKLTKEQMAYCFKANDLDGDGQLSQEELENMLRKSKSLH